MEIIHLSIQLLFSHSLIQRFCFFLIKHCWGYMVNKTESYIYRTNTQSLFNLLKWFLPFWMRNFTFIIFWGVLSVVILRASFSFHISRINVSPCPGFLALDPHQVFFWKNSFSSQKRGIHGKNSNLVLQDDTKMPTKSREGVEPKAVGTVASLCDVYSW